MAALANKSHGWYQFVVSTKETGSEVAYSKLQESLLILIHILHICDSTGHALA